MSLKAATRVWTTDVNGEGFTLVILSLECGNTVWLQSLLWDVRGHLLSGLPKITGLCSMSVLLQEDITIPDMLGHLDSLSSDWTCGIPAFQEAWRKFVFLCSGSKSLCLQDQIAGFTCFRPYWLVRNLEDELENNKNTWGHQRNPLSFLLRILQAS